MCYRLIVLIQFSTNLNLTIKTQIENYKPKLVKGGDEHGSRMYVEFGLPLAIESFSYSNHTFLYECFQFSMNARKQRMTALRPMWGLGMNTVKLFVPMKKRKGEVKEQMNIFMT